MLKCVCRFVALWNVLSVCPGRHIWCQSSPSPAGWDGGRWGQTGTDPWHPAGKTKNGERVHTHTHRRFVQGERGRETHPLHLGSCLRDHTRQQTASQLNQLLSTSEASKKDVNISRPPGETCESYQIFMWRQEPPVKSWNLPAAQEKDEHPEAELLPTKSLNILPDKLGICLNRWKRTTLTDFLTWQNKTATTTSTHTHTLLYTHLSWLTSQLPN